MKNMAEMEQLDLLINLPLNIAPFPHTYTPRIYQYNPMTREIGYESVDWPNVLNYRLQNLPPCPHEQKKKRATADATCVKRQLARNTTT